MANSIATDRNAAGGPMPRVLPQLSCASPRCCGPCRYAWYYLRTAPYIDAHSKLWTPKKTCDRTLRSVVECARRCEWNHLDIAGADQFTSCKSYDRIERCTQSASHKLLTVGRFAAVGCKLRRLRSW